MKMKKRKTKPMNSYARFSSAGIQMGLIIALSAWGGSALDEKQNNEKPIFTIIFSLLGVALGLYVLLKQVIKISRDKEIKK